MAHFCGNPYGALQPRASAVDVDAYRRSIIDATIATGDLFSPGRKHVRKSASPPASRAAAAAPDPVRKNLAELVDAAAE
jgi:hypothetical protein